MLGIPEYTIITLLFVVVVLTIWIMLLERKLARFLRGGKTETLGESLSSLEQEVKALSAFRKETEGYLHAVEKRLKRSVQGVGTVRFQAFKGTGDGGNQSFASAFINEKGDGVVISSIYSRNIVGVYAKPVSGGAATFELTPEEKEALGRAVSETRS